MAAYNGVNGTTMTESPLLRDILHDEWGYDGLVMSDWTAARSTEPAARAALDLAMPGPASRFGPWGDALVEAVQDGRVDEALIDDKVLRILRLAARVGGLTDVPAAPGSVAARDIARVAPNCAAAAAASFVLARNDGLLPLSRSGLGESPSSARTPRSRARSAAAAPPSSRPTRSPRSRACAPPGSTWRSPRGARAPADLGGPRALAAAAGRIGLRRRGPVLLALR